MEKARKGDLILVEETRANHYSVAAVREAEAKGRTLPSATTTYAFGVVASATREGVAKSWFPVGYGDETVSAYATLITQRFGSAPRTWVMSRKEIDVAAVMEAAKAHHWPGHPGQPQSFETFDDACAIARPHRLTVAS